MKVVFSCRAKRSEDIPRVSVSGNTNQPVDQNLFPFMQVGVKATVHEKNATLINTRNKKIWRMMKDDKRIVRRYYSREERKAKKMRTAQTQQKL
jgi:hypothetical protein